MRDLLLVMRRRQNRRQRRVWALETLQTRDDRASVNCTVTTTVSSNTSECRRHSLPIFCQYWSRVITKQTTKFRQPIGCPEKLPCGRAHTASRAPLRLESNSPTFCFLVSLIRVTTGKRRHRQWHDNNKIKALIGQEHGWRAVSRREIAPEAIECGTARVSRAGENKNRWLG